jgi:hypothetical protein
MAVTVAQLKLHLEAARSYLGAADYASALTAALQAQACIAALPDGGQAEANVHWRDVISTLIDNIRRARSDAAVATYGALQFTAITYEDPTT